MPSPNVLYLAWQCPTTRGILPVGRLVDLGQTGYEFAYIRAVHAAIAKGFAPLLAFPNLDIVYRSVELPALFRNRVMSSARPDYSAFVRQLGLEEVSASPVDILGRSGGRRTTNELEVFTPPTTREDGSRFIPATPPRRCGQATHCSSPRTSRTTRRPTLCFFARPIRASLAICRTI